MLKLLFRLVPLYQLRKGESSRSRAGRLKLLQSKILFAVIIFIMIIGATGSCLFLYERFSDHEKKTFSDCNGIKEKFDTLQVRYDNLMIKYDILSRKFDSLDVRYNNYELEKYPFSINQNMVDQFRSGLKGLIYEIGAQRCAMSISHNLIGCGYKPIYQYGSYSYTSISVIASANNGFGRTYSEQNYQNVPLHIFSYWMTKYNDDGYVEFHKRDADYIDKFIIKNIVFDYESVESCYIFGIENTRDVKNYGKWLGVIVFDFGEDYVKLDNEQTMRVKIFCNDISNYLNDRRKNQFTSLYNTKQLPSEFTQSVIKKNKSIYLSINEKTNLFKNQLVLNMIKNY